MSIEAGTLPDSQRGACERLIGRLPDRLQGQARREVTPHDAPGAAYGDPPIELRCVDPASLDLPRALQCTSTAGVDWWAPAWMLTDDSIDVVMVTVGRSPAVQVRLPATYRPPSAVMVDLAPAIKAATRSTEPCR